MQIKNGYEKTDRERTKPGSCALAPIFVNMHFIFLGIYIHLPW